MYNAPHSFQNGCESFIIGIISDADLNNMHNFVITFDLNNIDRYLWLEHCQADRIDLSEELFSQQNKHYTN